MKLSLEEKIPSFEELEKLSSQLLGSCQEDLEEVEGKSVERKNSKVDLTESVKDHRSHLDHMKAKLEEFNDTKRHCDNKISNLEKTLDTVNLIGADSEKLAKICCDLQELQQKVEGLEPKVEGIEALSNEIQEHHTHTDCKPIKEQADVTRENYDKLKLAVSNKVEEASSVAEELKKLENETRRAAEKMKNLSDRVEMNRPKKLELEEVEIHATAVKVKKQNKN